MQRFPLGHITDDYAPDKWTSMVALVGAEPEPAPAASPGLIMWADRIEHQPGGTCVGHAIAGGIYLKQGAANAALGQPTRVREFPSPLAITYNARVKGGYPERDVGCQPRLAFEGLTDYGYCAIENWISTDENICKQPSAEAYRLAVDQRAIQYYRVLNEGQAACEDVRQGISRENPVVIALTLNAAFQDLTDAIWKGPSGTIIGSHYVLGVEYTPDYLVILNSWGRNWGVNGFGKVAWSAIGDPSVTRDRYAITFAPAPVREAA